MTLDELENHVFGSLHECFRVVQCNEYPALILVSAYKISLESAIWFEAWTYVLTSKPHKWKSIDCDISKFNFKLAIVFMHNLQE